MCIASTNIWIRYHDIYQKDNEQNASGAQGNGKKNTREYHLRIK